MKAELYYRAVVDCWRLFKKYRVLQQTDEFWQKLHDDITQVYKQNKMTVFSKALLFVILDEIERIGNCKNEQRAEKTGSGNEPHQRKAENSRREQGY